MQDFSQSAPAVSSGVTMEDASQEDLCAIQTMTVEITVMRCSVALVSSKLQV